MPTEEAKVPDKPEKNEITSFNNLQHEKWIPDFGWIAKTIEEK